MVATFSPHREAGGTLHLPSHSGIHHVDASSAIRQLRRSLSRSPSKSSNFSLLTSRHHSPSKSTTPYVSSPLSPSRRTGTGNFVLLPSSSQQSPFAVPYPPSKDLPAGHATTNLPQKSGKACAEHFHRPRKCEATTASAGTYRGGKRAINS